VHYGVAGPHPQARYFFHDFGRFRLGGSATPSSPPTPSSSAASR
jgi:hypothetical protein